VPNPFLLTRVLLRFDEPAEDMVGNLSAAAFTPDGSLWLGSDEGITVERLSLIEPYIYGKHQSFSIGRFRRTL
jgi:hypothetical protein